MHDISHGLKSLNYSQLQIKAKEGCQLLSVHLHPHNMDVVINQAIEDDCDQKKLSWIFFFVFILSIAISNKQDHFQ